jgi:hypothetical protein
MLYAAPLRPTAANYVSVLDGATYDEKTRIAVPNGPGKGQ